MDPVQSPLAVELVLLRHTVTDRYDTTRYFVESQSGTGSQFWERIFPLYGGLGVKLGSSSFP